LPEEWESVESTSAGRFRFRFFWMSRTDAETALTPDHAAVYELTAAGRERG
jgi:hypothetical protein